MRVYILTDPESEVSDKEIITNLEKSFPSDSHFKFITSKVQIAEFIGYEVMDCLVITCDIEDDLSFLVSQFIAKDIKVYDATDNASSLMEFVITKQQMKTE